METRRITVQDMNQLVSEGFPAWQQLADTIGKTVAETRRSVEQGALTRAVIRDKFLAERLALLDSRAAANNVKYLGMTENGTKYIP